MELLSQTGEPAGPPTQQQPPQQKPGQATPLGKQAAVVVGAAVVVLVVTPTQRPPKQVSRVSQQVWLQQTFEQQFWSCAQDPPAYLQRRSACAVGVCAPGSPAIPASAPRTAPPIARSAP